MLLLYDEKYATMRSLYLCKPEAASEIGNTEHILPWGCNERKSEENMFVAHRHVKSSCRS